MQTQHEAVNDLPNREQRYQATRRATLVGAGVNSLLAVAQIVSGWLFQSQALIADGIHTLSDLLSDGVVLFASRHASASPDANHPYGHGRIETLATVAVGLLLALAGIGIAWAAGQRLMQPDTLTGPAPAALIFAALTLVAKEGLYQYTRRVARRIQSPLLQANAWHHRTDAISSVVVFIGIAGALAGWPWLDALAALFVALFILGMAWKLIFNSAAELIDTALEPEQVTRIQQVITAVPGVKSAHMLRTRKLGNESAADVHIQVAPRISVSEGHQIADEVYLALRQQMPTLSDITVHVDPENDEDQARNHGLALRPQISACIREAWADLPELEAIEQLGLHYLSGHVHIVVTLRLDAATTSAWLQQRAVLLSEHLRRHPQLAGIVGEVTILYHPRTNLVQTE